MERPPLLVRGCWETWGARWTNVVNSETKWEQLCLTNGEANDLLLSGETVVVKDVEAVAQNSVLLTSAHNVHAGREEDGEVRLAAHDPHGILGTLHERPHLFQAEKWVKC